MHAGLCLLEAQAASGEEVWSSLNPTESMTEKHALPEQKESSGPPVHRVRTRRNGWRSTTWSRKKHPEEGEPCAAAENSASPAPQAVDALGDVSDKDEPCAVHEMPGGTAETGAKSRPAHGSGLAEALFFSKSPSLRTQRVSVGAFFQRQTCIPNMPARTV